MLRIIKVTGNSLSPFFLPGDFVLIGLKPIFSRNLKVGDLIVFDHAEYGRLIKQVIEVHPQNDHIYVGGTHAMSLGVSQLGPISSSAVIGKVLFHIKNPASHSKE